MFPFLPEGAVPLFPHDTARAELVPPGRHIGKDGLDYVQVIGFNPGLRPPALVIVVAVDKVVLRVQQDSVGFVLGEGIGDDVVVVRAACTHGVIDDRLQDGSRMPPTVLPIRTLPATRRAVVPAHECSNCRIGIGFVVTCYGLPAVSFLKT